MQQLGGLGCVLYNLSLGVYNLAAIKLQMKERDIAKKLEPWIHIVPNGFAIASTVFLLAKSQYAPLPEQHICWIGAYPQGCIGDPDVECERGSAKTPIYAAFLAVLPFFVAYFLVFAIMMIIIYTIVKQKRKNDRWRMGGNHGKCCFYQHTDGSLFKTSSASQAGKIIRHKRRFNLRKVKKAKSAKILAYSKAVAASRSGNKEDPLSFDVNKVKKKIRRESHLARDAPIDLTSSKNSSIAKGNTPLRSKNSSSKRTRTKDANANPVHQCLLYMASFLVCFIFTAIVSIYGIMGKESPFLLLLLARTLTPLNGLFLILIYSRPKVKALRSRNQDLTFFDALVIIFKAGLDNGIPTCIDEGGIDAPRLRDSERERRQEIVRQQYNRKSVTYKQASSPSENEKDLAIPQGYNLESDKDIASIEKVATSMFEIKSTKSASDIETGHVDAGKITQYSHEYDEVGKYIRNII